jgi:hypothetical protein
MFEKLCQESKAMLECEDYDNDSKGGIMILDGKLSKI